MTDKKTVFISLAVVLGFAGCAGTSAYDQAITDAQANLALAKMQCVEQFPDPAAKPVMPHMRCLTTAENSFSRRMVQIEPTLPLDLALLRSSRKLVAAERYDAGDISQVQYDLLIQQAESDFTAAANRRYNERDMVRAAQAQASAVERQARAAEQQAQAAAERSRMDRGQTRCRTEPYSGEIICETQPALF